MSTFERPDSGISRDEYDPDAYAENTIYLIGRLHASATLLHTDRLGLPWREFRLAVNRREKSGYRTVAVPCLAFGELAIYISALPEMQPVYIKGFLDATLAQANQWSLRVIVQRLLPVGTVRQGLCHAADDGGREVALPEGTSPNVVFDTQVPGNRYQATRMERQAMVDAVRARAIADAEAQAPRQAPFVRHPWMPLDVDKALQPPPQVAPAVSSTEAETPPPTPPASKWVPFDLDKSRAARPAPKNQTMLVRR